MSYDTIIIGLGAIGSAALHHLAARGQTVLGLDQYRPPHTRGSSHGETRAMRFAYAEGGHYVPLLKQAREHWRTLEEETGRRLYTLTGGVYANNDHDAVARTVYAAQEQGIDCEALDARQVGARYPQISLSDEFRAICDHEAGFLYCEAAMQAHLDQAQHYGGQMHYETLVTDISARSDGTVHVTTATEHYTAANVIVAAGAWVRRLLPGYADAFTLRRTFSVWYEVQAAADFRPGTYPVFSLSRPDGAFYTVPVCDTPGLKAGLLGTVEPIIDTPGMMPTEVPTEEIEALYALLAPYLPGVNKRTVASQPCLVTYTPDTHFCLGPLPETPSIIAGAACSGHAFKMSSALGAVLADYACGETSAFDLAPHAPSRLSQMA